MDFIDEVRVHGVRAFVTTEKNSPIETTLGSNAIDESLDETRDLPWDWGFFHPQVREYGEPLTVTVEAEAGYRHSPV